MDSTKSRCRFSVQAHSLTNQLSEDTGQLFKRVQSGVLFLGRNESLQPHCPLWNRFDTPAVEL